jgi:hypothetical protein
MVNRAARVSKASAPITSAACSARLATCSECWYEPHFSQHMLQKRMIWPQQIHHLQRSG